MKQRSLNVWFDEMELQLGDSLRQRIDEGIRLSRYGVVVLSPNFFAKNWPKWELDGLAERELSGGKVVVLPVWHNILHDEVAAYSPTLANKVAAKTSEGIHRVAVPSSLESPPTALESGKSSTLGPTLPQFNSFTVPTAGSQPAGIAVGGDGNLWFTELIGNKIGRMTPSGVVKEFPLPTANSQPTAITSGSDGNLWFVERLGGKIGRITTAGLITESPVSNAEGIVRGRDGNLWFTVSDGIGKITPEGNHSVFPLANGSQPEGITVGPDGNLWFTEFGPNGNKIGTITPSGTIKAFAVPTANSQPAGIVTGRDGNLWFTEQNPNANKIGRITPSGGSITEFPVPTAGSKPSSIVAGPDGNLWFLEYLTSKIGRITLSGSIDDFPIRPTALYPGGITIGPDGNLWFAALFSNTIVRAQIR